MSKNSVIPVVLAVVERDGKILFLKRTKPPFQGLWSIPGGKIEFDEYLTDALKRELHEETGLAVKSAELLGVVSELVKDEEKVVNGHLIHIFKVNSDGEKLKSSAEGELSWLGRDEILAQQDNITPTDLFMLNKFLFNKEHFAYNCLVEHVNGEYRFISNDKI